MQKLYRDLRDDEIRCLRLKASPGDQIECSMEYINLDSNPAFVALSYVWGDKANPRNIEVDGHIVDTTMNLHAALCQLKTSSRLFWNHLPTEPLIWIDAVCINQEDLDERAAQVRRMGKIYSQASTVIIWLGQNPETENMDNNIRIAFKLAAGLSQIVCAISTYSGQEFFNNSMSIFDDYSPWEVFKADLEPYISHDLYIKTLINIRQRAWFSRLWTVQEAALPVESAIVLAGRHNITLDSLCIHFKNWEATINRGARASSFRVLETPNVSDIRVHFLQERVLKSRSTHSWRPNARVKPTYETFANELHAILITTDLCKCSLRQDHIYGLLGLTNPPEGGLPDGLEVDYRADVEKIFHSYAMFLFRYTGKLSLLFFARRPSKIERIPNWVPDFSRLHGRVRAVSNVCGNIRFSPDGQCMFTQGVALGTIESITEFSDCKWDQIADNAYPDTASLSALVKEFHHGILQSSANLRGVTLDMAAGDWLRNQITGAPPENERVTEFSLLKQCYDLLCNKKEFSSEQVSLMLKILLRGELSPRKIADAIYREGAQHFVLADGTMGVSGYARVGDVVCALKGAYDEVLLRPKEGRVHEFLGMVNLAVSDDGSKYDENFFEERTVEEWILV